MTIWAENLRVLKRANPALAKVIAGVKVPEDHRIALSRRGAPYLRVGRQCLHSAYDPVKEGEDWHRVQNQAGTEPLVIFGLGLGYHILPFLREQRVTYVVEPSLAVARLALENQDLRALLDYNGLRVGKDFRDLPRPAQLLCHDPSRRLAPGLYRRLAAFLSDNSGVPGYLRILVVSPLWGGSHPIARYSARGFRQLGHDTELLDFSPFYGAHKALADATGNHGKRLWQDWLKFLEEILLGKFREFRPDMVFCLAQAPVTPKLLRTLKAEGALVAYWFVEDFQVFPYWRELAPGTDVFFTLQREPFIQDLCKVGAEQAAFLPLAADPEVFRPLPLTPEEKRRYGAALAFVGAGYRNRQEFFPGFLDLDFKIWGSDWPLNSRLAPVIQNRGARVSEEEAVKIFNASLINLNLHSSPFHNGINPDGDYLNPRVFDLAAAGAFQLVDWRSQLPEFFRPEEELATFTSLAEAREKISYFLAHEDERARIAAAGRQRCLQEHTYAHRLQEALDIMEDLHPQVLPRRSKPENPGRRLRQRFPEDHPLQALLAQVPEEITELGELVRYFREGDAPLTKPEAMLWLLHEFQQGLRRGRF